MVLWNRILVEARIVAENVSAKLVEAQGRTVAHTLIDYQRLGG